MNYKFKLVKPAGVFLLFSSVIMVLSSAVSAQGEQSADIEEII